MVDIIPKKTSQIPLSLNFLFYLSLILLVFILALSLVSKNSIKNSRKTLEELDNVLAQENIPENTELEKELLSYQKKIQDFSYLINQHLAGSNFFDFIESKTHPKVWFTGINLDSRRSTVQLSGRTESFVSLGQQMLILKEEKIIKELKLDKALMGREGKIDFGLSLSLDPKIFR